MNETTIVQGYPKRSILRIVPELAFTFTHDKPNWWWRMWQRLLLGWKWEDVG